MTLDTGLLFETHHAALFRYLVRLTGDEDTASDVLQETFLKALQRPPAGEHQVRAWLFTVATNTARGLLRAGSRRRLLLLSNPARLPVADPPPDAAIDLEKAEMQSAVRDALGALAVKERTALLMREEGFAHREIAEALGTTTKSIGTLLARAVRKVAAGLHAQRDELV